MGCLIVDPSVAIDATAELPPGLTPAVISVGVNSPLFDADGSDVHAEVNAVASCAKRGIPTQGMTIYITMPPCKHCFMVLQVCSLAPPASHNDF